VHVEVRGAELDAAGRGIGRASFFAVVTLEKVGAPLHLTDPRQITLGRA
jgi:hypothetical protein